MNYDKYQFYYPPRVEQALSTKFLEEYSSNDYLVQPKLNGDSAIIFTNGKELIIKNRHKQAFKKSTVKLEAIIQDFCKENKVRSWIVLVGEWMTKSKKNAENKSFNDNFILFDILVSKGIYLLNFTFEERYEIIKDLCSSSYYDGHILKTNVENLYLVNNLENNNMTDLFIDVAHIDMYEGLVLKKKNAKLEIGLNEKNNSKTQVKFRKPTKNYHY